MTDTVLTNRASVTSTHQTVPDTAEVSVTIDDLSTEVLTFTGTGVYEANAGNVIVDVVTPACLTGLEVVRNDSDHANANLTLGTGRYWAVTTVPASCSAGFTVNLTLPHPDVPDEDDRLCRYTGSEWDCGEASDHTFDVVAGTVTRFNVTQFSDWTVGGDAFVAVDDEAVTNEDEAIGINLVMNDINEDAGTLFVASFSAATNGEVVPNGTTGVTYDPDLNFNGVDTFTYVVSNGVLTDTATVTVTVLPVNDPPVVVNDQC